MAMSSSEFAATIKAKYPAYASMPDDQLAQLVINKHPEYKDQVTFSVADGAAARLKAQGLTPQDVKAGRGVTTPDQIQTQDPKTVNGGFAGGLFSNPLAGPIDSIKRHGAAVLAGDESGVTAPLRVAADVLIPRPDKVYEEAMRRGAANESTSDMYGQVAQAAALSALGPAKGLYGKARGLSQAEAATRAGSAVTDAAADPALRDMVGKEIIDSGQKMKNPRTDIATMAEGKANAIDTDAAILNRPQAARTGPILKDIAANREALFNEVKRVPSPANPDNAAILRAKLEKAYPMAEVVDDNGELVVNQIRHPSMWDKANDLSKLSRHIKDSANRGMISNETLRNLTQDYNYYADKGGDFGDAAQTNPVRRPADAHVAESLRDVVNQDPVAASLNAEKSQWIRAKNELPAGAPTAPDIAGGLKKLGATAIGDAGGAVIGGPIGHFITAVSGGGTVYAIAKLAKDILTSPAFRTGSAIKRAQIGRLISTGDYVGAAKEVGLALGGSDLQNTQDR